MKNIYLLSILIILVSSCKKTEIADYNPNFIQTWHSINEYNNVNAYTIIINPNGMGSWEKNNVLGIGDKKSEGLTYERNGKLIIGDKKLKINSEPIYSLDSVGIPGIAFGNPGPHYEMTIDGILYWGGY